MKKPKQLLPWKKDTLIETAITSALGIDNASVFVVLGAYKEEIETKIKSYPIGIIENKDWENGLGTSIVCGIKHIQKQKKIDGVLLMLADQPLVSTNYLEQIISAFKINSQYIVASKYPNEILGVPALFDKYYFKDLELLTEDKGAKAILKRYTNNVATVNGSKLLVDIDTEEAYKKLIDSETSSE